MSRDLVDLALMVLHRACGTARRATPQLLAGLDERVADQSDRRDPVVPGDIRSHAPPGDSPGPRVSPRTDRTHFTGLHTDAKPTEGHRAADTGPQSGHHGRTTLRPQNTKTEISLRESNVGNTLSNAAQNAAS
ncbi:unnamed protein product [Cutaneotrichosporon oleaginosum]